MRADLLTEEGLWRLSSNLAGSAWVAIMQRRARLEF